MAQLGAGPHRYADIAQALGRNVNSTAPTRSQLIEKGMIWSPSHNDTAFTIPTIDEFMRGIMPGDGWQREGSPAFAQGKVGRKVVPLEGLEPPTRNLGRCRSIL